MAQKQGFSENETESFSGSNECPGVASGTKNINKIITKNDFNVVESAFESLWFRLFKKFHHLSYLLN